MVSRRTFMQAVSGTVVGAFVFGSKLMAALYPNQPDHIVLGCRDLDEGIGYVEKLSGYRAEFGGSHPGRGTRNALLKLGERCYLEILAPDPEQQELVWHKEIASLEQPLIVGWAVAIKNIDRYAERLRGKGIGCIGPTSGSRVKPNGEVLRWKLLLREDDRQGILPFYIEWAADSPHPASDAPGACLFRSMQRTGQLIETPAPGSEFRRVVIPNMPAAQLHVVIAGQFGEFELTTKSVPSEAWTNGPRPK